MVASRISALLGTDVVPNPSPKAIEGLMDKINDLLGNAMWIGIICGSDDCPSQPARAWSWWRSRRKGRVGHCWRPHRNFSADHH